MNMAGLSGIVCGLCATVMIGSDERSYFELVRTHMLLSHPGTAWTDTHGKAHR